MLAWSVNFVHFVLESAEVTNVRALLSHLTLLWSTHRRICMYHAPLIPGRLAGLLLVVILVARSSGAMASELVPDPALRAAIAVALDHQGEIGPRELEKLTRLRAVGQDIGDLTGLEYATNLSILVIGANRVTDLSPLARLSNLTELHAWNNAIRDVSPLTELKALRKLQLGANQVSDLIPLTALTDLSHLDLAANGIDNIGALAAMTGLKWLSLDDNEIADLSPLQGLARLTKLWLWRNRVNSIESLRSLKNLRWLEIGANELGSVGALSDLPAIVRVSFQDNYIDVAAPEMQELLEGLATRGVTVQAAPQRVASFWATGEE